MKPRVTLPLVGLMSLVLIAAAFVFRPLTTTITPENAAQIKVGMSTSDVVALLGESRDELSLPPPPPPSPPALPPPPPSPALLSADYAFSTVNRPRFEFDVVWRRRWVSEVCTIAVDFTDERVSAVNVSPSRFDSTSAYLHWHARRAVGAAPDTPLEKELHDLVVVPAGTRRGAFAPGTGFGTTTGGFTPGGGFGTTPAPEAKKD